MPTKRIFGPSAPSKLALMGIRFIDGDDGALPVVPAEPVTPVVPAAPVVPAEDKTDWKAESRKWEARSKENSAAAQRVAEIDEASKTEAQKLEARATKAESERDTDRSELAKYRVATKHGISEKELALLTGKNEADLEVQAAAILSIRGPVGPVVPKPDPSIGPKGSTAPRGLESAVKAHYATA